MVALREERSRIVSVLGIADGHHHHGARPIVVKWTKVFSNLSLLCLNAVNYNSLAMRRLIRHVPLRQPS